MARNVDPAYYETIERFARNQLIENQFKKTEKIDAALDLCKSSTIANAFYGSWASWSLPNCLDNGIEMIEGCCLGSGIRGCFLVWDYAIEKRQDTVSVNMAFSRNSPWVEVISYQPYQGKVDLIVHDAPRLQIRIPSWVNELEMAVLINNTDQAMRLADGRYLAFCGLKKGDPVTITYPLNIVETCEYVNGIDYRVRWRGDTVVGISPKGAVYPIYERSWMEAGEAPLIDGQSYKDQLGKSVHW